MQDNPLAVIEFVLFIGFVVWLFLWQRRSSSQGQKPEETDTQRDESAGSETR